VARSRRISAMPLYAVFAVMAPFIGSFLAVLMVRLPKHEPVVFERSACLHCGHALGPLDLLPFFSWALLGGKCRYCRAAIGAFYPLVELAAILMVLWAATETDGSALAASCVFGWALLAITIIDWRDFIVPNPLSLFVAATGLLFAAGLDVDAFIGHAIGMVAGYAVFIVVAWVYERIRGREGLGGGDAKLLGALGAWVSWTGLPSVLIIASIMAMGFVLARLLWMGKSTPADRIAFALFLAPAGWLVWLYGPLLPT
jgi:leader peptidase (prepilin peptidase) / N-methyltransferase